MEFAIHCNNVVCTGLAYYLLTDQSESKMASLLPSVSRKCTVWFIKLHAGLFDLNH